MDKIFLAFIGIVALTAIIIYATNVSEETRIYDNTAKTNLKETTTTRITPTTTIKETTTSTPTTTTIKPTTTTTIPTSIQATLFKVDKCRNTAIGKLNTILVNITEDKITGNWGYEPNPKFYFTCDGSEEIAFERVYFRGGINIRENDSITQIYRVAARCGRSQPVDDLSECETLNVYMKLDDVKIQTINNKPAQTTTTTTTTIKNPTTTTTTIYHNPYLDRFKGEGLRKADFDIAWMCPSCVPAVNKIIIEEVGVRSRSIGYKQDINYVIYNPEIVSLERIRILTNAGGTSTLIDDYPLDE